MTPQGCGFEDIRRDERGLYFCRACGMTTQCNFEQMIGLMAPEFSEQLAAQCAVPTPRPKLAEAS